MVEDESEEEQQFESAQNPGEEVIKGDNKMASNNGI